MNHTESDLRTIDAAATQFLEREAASNRRRAALDDMSALSALLWRKAGALGWGGLMVPVGSGGLGLGWEAATTLSRNLGRHLAPGPFVDSVALFSWAVQKGLDAAVAAPLLVSVVEGRTQGAMALTGPSGRRAAGSIDITARRDAGSWVLRGVAGPSMAMTGGHMAVVAAVAGSGPALFALPLDAEGSSVEPVRMVDATRCYATLRLDDVRVDERYVLRNGGSLREELLDLGALLLAADALGAASRALDLGVEYAKARIQFGRPIGSFQAVKHKVVNMYTALRAADVSVQAVARYLDGPSPAGGGRGLAEAIVVAREAALHITGDAIQVHGGIGYTWEHDCHLLLKRAHVDAALAGSTSFFSERIVEDYCEARR